MGDVHIILNNTSSGAGGDDEDLNELSGSGDGQFFSSSESPDVKPSSHRPSGQDTGTDEDDKSLLYIICASAVFAALVIVIVIMAVCYRQRTRARRNRLKAQLANQENEMKSFSPKKETRVFGEIGMDPELLERERMLSRLQDPPSSFAPPPPTTSTKARIAPEAETLLKSINISQSVPGTRLNSESKPLLQSGDTADLNVYEEIGNMVKVSKAKYEDQLHSKSGDTENVEIKDSNHSNRNNKKSIPVAKPRKNLANVGSCDLSGDIPKSSSPE